MASTSNGSVLTEAHRVAQARLRNSVAANVMRLWPLLEFDNLNRSSRSWLNATVPVVVEGAATSVQLSEQYFQEFRSAEIGRTLTDLPSPTPVNVAAVETSLLVTGPYELKRSMANGRSLDDAVSRARLTVAQAGARHALNAGRRSLVASSRADTRATFWSRVTSSRPCGFCAMLASRGAVYRQDTARFESHDKCACTVEAGYVDGALSSSAERYAEQWQDLKSSGEVASSDLPKAFRRLVEAT